MKIAFICGSLEAGRDGVGDYTRRLAIELKRHGNDVVLIAFNDKFLEGSVQKEVLPVGSGRIEVLRLPAAEALDIRLKHAKELIDAFEPDWISLQFVSYAFNKKGLPFDLAMYMQRLTKGIKVHIMFHEIWQGESVESTFKDKIVGFIQKKVCLLIVSKLKPLHVSTTNEYYRHCFLKAGLKLSKIPVFSNMPVGDAHKKAVFGLLPKAVLDNRSGYIIAGFFGGLHYHNNLPNRLKHLAGLIKAELNKELIVTHIGRSGGVKEQFETITKLMGIKTVVLDEWPEEDVADYLAALDIGLTNYPKVLYEKSGSVSALLYNACPVIFLKDSFEADNRDIAEIKEWDEDFGLQQFIEQDKGFSAKYGIGYSYDQYVKMFND